MQRLIIPGVESSSDHTAAAVRELFTSRYTSSLGALKNKEGFSLYVPSLRFFVDYAAIIAKAGAMSMDFGKTSTLYLTANPSLKVS